MIKMNEMPAKNGSELPVASLVIIFRFAPTYVVLFESILDNLILIVYLSYLSGRYNFMEKLGFRCDTAISGKFSTYS